MRPLAQRWLGLVILMPLLMSSPCSVAEVQPVELVKGLRVVPGSINGILISSGGKTLAVYGDPREAREKVDTVLFTHHRRDVVWAGRPLVDAGARAIVPAAEAEKFSGVDTFWAEFEEKRFHDYEQQSTKVLAKPLPAAKKVQGGELLTWETIPIRVLDTPGYTRGAVTYLIELDGRRIAFTGDLIYGDGKLLDLYSLQDAIPEAQIGGYHGYAGRLGDLITSLQKVAAERPDILVPVRGPVIREPLAAIDALIARIRALYANYLAIDAHRYYSSEEDFLIKARRVLGAEAQATWMPPAETSDHLPSWIVPIDNARLIVSSDKTGFLVDCGSPHIIEVLDRLRNAGELTSIEHVFVSHYHDDHTDCVAELAGKYGAAVHASKENVDILEHPGAYRMPCLTTRPLHISSPATSGEHWRWKEFEMSLFYFPGQTLRHDALLVKKESGEQVFFAGDSFTPSGIDDYCLLNRNLMHPGMGFFRCLELLEQAAPGAMLINQHVAPLFRFSAEQLAQIRQTLEKRVELLHTLLPWDDPNFGIDEGWARFYPYARTAHPGETLQFSIRIMNHSSSDQVFHIKPNVPVEWGSFPPPPPLHISAGSEGACGLSVPIPPSVDGGLYVLTADLRWDQWDLREWTEAMVRVAKTPEKP